jgi:hypothetical protein
MECMTCCKPAAAGELNHALVQECVLKKGTLAACKTHHCGLGYQSLHDLQTAAIRYPARFRQLGCASQRLLSPLLPCLCYVQVDQQRWASHTAAAAA